jgi:hypothetical protein
MKDTFSPLQHLFCLYFWVRQERVRRTSAAHPLHDLRILTRASEWMAVYDRLSFVWCILTSTHCPCNWHRSFVDGQTGGDLVGTEEGNNIGLGCIWFFFQRFSLRQYVEIDRWLTTTNNIVCLHTSSSHLFTFSLCFCPFPCVPCISFFTLCCSCSFIQHSVFHSVIQSFGILIQYSTFDSLSCLSTLIFTLFSNNTNRPI